VIALHFAPVFKFGIRFFVRTSFSCHFSFAIAISLLI
jgi:hypothetical protein